MYELNYRAAKLARHERYEPKNAKGAITLAVVIKLDENVLLPTAYYWFYTVGQSVESVCENIVCKILVVGAIII